MSDVRTSQPIWTLEARDSVMLEVIASYFDQSDEQVRREIWGSLYITIAALQSKGISYGALRNALVPRGTRQEVALLFDRARIESGSYGYKVAERVIPLLPRNLLCATRSGDLIIDDQDLGLELLERYVVAHRPLELSDTRQAYCIYLNNLSPTMMRDITSQLQAYEPYLGYTDVSTLSPMKDWLSTTLVTGYLKARGVVLNGHEDDVPDTENWNMLGWPWEENGFACKSLRHMYFHLFLGYKIERRVIPGLESDTHFALTAISDRPQALEGLPVEVQEAKAEYLRSDHGAGLGRAGLAQMGAEELGRLIKAKISENYIYYLRYYEESRTSLFDIMLEFPDEKRGKVTRLVAGLEYKTEPAGLTLVTLH